MQNNRIVSQDEHLDGLSLDEIQGLIRTGDGRISRRLAGNSCQYRARHSISGPCANHNSVTSKRMKQ